MVSRKIEVIHPMLPKSVDFSDSVRMVRDFVRCDMNELSKQVLMAAKRLNVKSGKQAAVKEVEYTDTHLLDYVFLIRAGESAKDDVVVKTSFGQVTKEGMCSLKPRKWVADMVIDMFGIYSTMLKPDLLYIPSTARHLNPQRDKNLGRNYIKTSYMPTDGVCVKAVFIPIIDNEHWFLIV
ncbi:uncharacterized protein LOC141654776 [Silene latifolia]|uniref:uncharacterized protein LOC141654776 n=1 Tax=Silene latifolia TaxID=37657 RepID=UPI003D78A862